MELELHTVPFIILAVYIIIECLKLYVIKTDEKKKGIPILAGLIGGVIGVLLFFFANDMISFDNVITACTDGMASGLASVGCNQIYKQFKKFNTITDTSSDE